MVRPGKAGVPIALLLGSSGGSIASQETLREWQRQPRVAIDAVRRWRRKLNTTIAARLGNGCPPARSGRVVMLAVLLGSSLLSARSAPAQDVLTLDEAYVLASEQNPMLAAARAAIQASRSREAAATRPPDPQLQLGIMNVGIPGLETNMSTSMVPSVQLMQMIPTAGKLRLTRDISRQRTRVVEAEAGETWWEVRSQVAAAFYELYRTEQQIGVMQESLQLLETFQQVARAMYESGQGRQSDVLRASVEIARMSAEITRMRGMRDVAATMLNAELNRSATADVPSGMLPPLPAALPELETLYAMADSTRPALALARARLQQAETEKRLARREIWPDVTVGIEYGQRRAPGDGVDMDGMPAAATTERMGSLMVRFTLPVFARQRQLPMRDEAEAMSQMAQADLTSTRNEVEQRITQLVVELERDRTLIELLRGEIIPQAEANVNSALASFRQGDVDFMTLIDSQMSAIEFRQELFGLIADYGVRVAELERATGQELVARDALLVEVP